MNGDEYITVFDVLGRCFVGHKNINIQTLALAGLACWSGG